MPVTDGEDHYAVLGIAEDSTPEQIRDAYRSLARRLHPDRSPDARPAARMARVNEAYYVLRDAGRRAVYDAGRRPSSSAVGSAAGPSTPRRASGRSASVPRGVPPTPPSRARFPWRWVVTFAAVGSLAVASLSVFGSDPDQPAPDNLLQVGSCVAIEPNGDAREVRCTEGDDLVVANLVAFDESCPYGTSAHRDRQGLGIACVSPSPPDANE